MLPLQKEKHKCNQILTGRKGKYGRMRREGGAQGREGVRRGKGEGVGEGGTGLSDWFKRTCQASGHPAGLRGMVAKCSLAPKAMKAAKAMSCLRQPLGAVVSTEDTPQEELPLHLDACHSCAMREVGIDDNGSQFSEGYLDKRRLAYHDQHAGFLLKEGSAIAMV